MTNIKNYPIDYSKIPAWAKVDSKFSPQENCGNNRHIPVAVNDVNGEIINVFCQDCAKPMTVNDWLNFFGYQ